LQGGFLGEGGQGRARVHIHYSFTEFFHFNLSYFTDVARASPA
jgi:hypothetical protein